MEHSSALERTIAEREGIPPGQVTLHSDNGGPMKGATMRATLDALGIMESFSRPRVSNDNPYSESLFRTLKYRPEYPRSAFADRAAACAWVAAFVDWYRLWTGTTWSIGTVPSGTSPPNSATRAPSVRYSRPASRRTLQHVRATRGDGPGRPDAGLRSATWCSTPGAPSDSTWLRNRTAAAAAGRARQVPVELTAGAGPDTPHRSGRNPGRADAGIHRVGPLPGRSTDLATGIRLQLR
jgi:hypothetical protein